jgi:hypothetical protein
MNAKLESRAVGGRGDYSGYPHLAELGTSKGASGRKGVHKTAQRVVPQLHVKSAGYHEKFRAGLHYVKGLAEMMDFRKLFERKKEKEMQRRAEESRNKAIEDEIEKVARNITNITEELRKKKNG